MGVGATQEVDVQVQTGIVGECRKKFEAERRGKRADALFGKVGAIDDARAAREIDDRTREGLVHRHVSRTESRDAGFVAQGVRQGQAQADADVFDGVVGVDFEVAFAGDVEVEQGVSGEGREHVVEKADARVDV